MVMNHEPHEPLGVISPHQMWENKAITVTSMIYLQGESQNGWDNSQGIDYDIIYMYIYLLYSIYNNMHTAYIYIYVYIYMYIYILCGLWKPWICSTCSLTKLVRETWPRTGEGWPTISSYRRWMRATWIACKFKQLDWLGYGICGGKHWWSWAVNVQVKRTLHWGGVYLTWLHTWRFTWEIVPKHIPKWVGLQ